MCRIEKPLNEYFKNRARKDGVDSYCKLCKKSITQSKSERVNAYNRKWRKDNKEAMQLIEKKRNSKPERVIYNKIYSRRYERKPETKLRNLIRNRQNRAENPEKYRMIDRKIYNDRKRGKAEFISKCAEKNKKQYNKNKSYYIIKSHHRYALKKGAEGSHAVKEWLDLVEEFNHRCIRCFRINNLTRDHIIPLSMGGSDYIGNIQPLCKKCNSSKGVKSNDYRIIARVLIGYMKMREISSLFSNSQPVHIKTATRCTSITYIATNAQLRCTDAFY